MSPIQAQAVRDQLERLVATRHFNQSRRYPALLRFVVEAALRDETEMLRERAIGHLVFDREPDYDTNADPIVRSTAAEVRKRLAQYYYEEGDGAELHIELKAGSYIPDFIFPPPPGPPEAPLPTTATQANTLLPVVELEAAPRVGSSEPGSPVPSLAVPVWRRVPAAGLGVVALALGIVLILLMLAAGFGVWQHQHRRSATPALDAVWSPLFDSGRGILVCLGQSTMYEPAKATTDPLQSPPDNDSLLQAFADKRDFVPLPDVQSFSRISALLGSRGHSFRLQGGPSTLYSQLREGPVILIGALNNPWTLNRSATLRFHFAGPGGTDHFYWIEDASHPGARSWRVDARDPRSKVVEDYAIIARFSDEGTGQIVMIAAGLAGSGTKAASEFLTDERRLEDLTASAPAGWEHKNFEAVLQSQVIDGMQGQPKVVAKVFW